MQENKPLLITRRNNMDLVRYYLALSVFIAHFNYLTGFEIPWPTNSFTGVGGFFALSGFLVFGSFLKKRSVKIYLERRARRILPPYFFIVLLCSIGLVTISDRSILDYFQSSQWLKYTLANLSFLNFIEPCLPGVFSGNVTQAVNGSLWTMKTEWLLYLSVPIVFWCYTRFKWNKTFVFISIYLLSIAYRLTFLFLFQSTGQEIYNILSRQILGQLMFFYSGVLIYFYFDKFMKYRWHIFFIAFILVGLREYIPFYSFTIGPIIVASLVLFFSMVGKWGHFFSRIDNVSYDMYLFHFPVIQLAVHLGVCDYGPGVAFTVVLVTTVLLSILSWSCIGKRFMYKPKISQQ